jgi:translation initiation factor IF-2
MTEDKKNNTGRLTLTLNKGDSGTLSLGDPTKFAAKKQHLVQKGKTVTVQVKKSRTFNKDINSKINELASDNSEGGLTSEELKTRLMVLKNANITNKQQEEEQELLAQKIKEAEAEAEAKISSDEEKNVIDEVKIDNIQEEPVIEVKQEEQHKHHKFTGKSVSDTKEEADEPKGHIKHDTKAAIAPKKWEDRRSTGKIVIHKIQGDEEDGPRRTRSLASIRRAKAKHARKEQQLMQAPEKVIREVILPEIISVQELAQRMSERSADVIKELMKLGIIATLNQNIDADTAELVIVALGHKLKRVTESDVENVITDETDDANYLEPRAPVVTIMGHVDHGKTSLLDALRATDVAGGESGGITQHIGAYQVSLSSDKKITFLDTPGHEAFTAMRSRGAKATDIVVLVVAADDGIMAQTIEAINHAKAANVPIIVAVNKIDKDGADPSRVKNELLQHDLVPEEMGGDIMIIEVSAKKKLNLDKLEEAILLQAEILELKANPNRAAGGIVVESKIDKGRGSVATLLVQRGTLRVGDIVVAGSAFGKVRGINDDKGKAIKEALPSMPVEIIGLGGVPEAGDSFDAVTSDKQAREIAEYRERKQRIVKNTIHKSSSAMDIFAQSLADSKVKELPIIVKGDVNGSVEAIVASLLKITHAEIKISILHSAVGGITESDVTLARASNALILAFNVRASAKAKEMADRDGADIRYYSIIYDLLDDMKLAASGMLAPKIREHYLGSAEIRQVFNVTKSGKIAGCYVLNGMVKRGAKVRLLRDNIVIHEGKLKTLKRFKDDAKEVKEGFECGMAFENYEDIREKDIIEAFELIEEKQEL